MPSTCWTSCGERGLTGAVAVVCVVATGDTAMLGMAGGRTDLTTDDDEVGVDGDGDAGSVVALARRCRWPRRARPRVGGVCGVVWWCVRSSNTRQSRTHGKIWLCGGGGTRGAEGGMETVRGRMMGRGKVECGGLAASGPAAVVVVVLLLPWTP